MSKVKVSGRFEIMDVITQGFGRKFQSKLGKTLVAEMKNDISKGNSPVRGERRFARYKNPDKYPGNLKGKRPVNLNLTGEMLRHLRFQLNQNKRFSVDIGIINAPHDVQERAVAHNSGTKHMAARKFIPWDSGDQLTVRIVRAMISLYKKQLAALIKKGNN